MTIAAFFTQTDASELAAGTAIRTDPRLADVYAQATVLESWRSRLLDSRLGPGLPFWYEAQNDYLLSLVHAGNGVWRSSLQALRSFIENATGAIYYSEHPVEAKRFVSADFRLTWSQTKEYFNTYPYASAAANFRTSAITALASEYADLSKAVHGSSESFRMTAGRQFPLLCSSDRIKIGAWRTRALASAKAINSVLLLHFSSDLTGARLRPLRDELSAIYSTRDRSRIRQSLNIVIPNP